ncbi:alpha-2-glucosyltransferase Alg10 [Gaertneriomyces semiglobifer]|nr:alpha-2-glucosyltransferase Alg10 [Gaertneriomyces semiglobifer]
MRPRPIVVASLLTAAGIFVTVITALLSRYINARVPDPYMDEVFHVGQAQQYCSGNFATWDPKITTPPGLYGTSYLFASIQSWGLSPSPSLCFTTALRSHNAVFLLGTLLVQYMILQTLHPSVSKLNHVLSATALCLFPISYFFHFMYYTDPGSTFFVLTTYLLALRGSTKWSAVMGLISVTYRQTNIIWVLFAAGVRLLMVLGNTLQPGTVGPPITARWHEMRSLAAVIKVILRFITLAIRNLRTTIATLWPYISVTIAFAAFLIWNGGIVLGDKSNHVATIHVPQLFYFLSTLFGFTLITGAPDMQSLPSALRKAGVRGWLTIATSGIVFWLSVYKFTIEHPFLLSDNRHYSFYVWKNIYRRHRLARYLVIPGYLVAAFICGRRIVRAQAVLFVLLYVVATVLTLVPTPLLEFRYYIIPLLMYRLHVAPPRKALILLEAAIYMVITAITVWIFGEKGFAWPSEPGKVQRFMW